MPTVAVQKPRNSFRRNNCIVKLLDVVQYRLIATICEQSIATQTVLVQVNQDRKIEVSIVEQSFQTKGTLPIYFLLVS